MTTDLAAGWVDSYGLGTVSLNEIKQLLNFWPIILGVCCLVGLGIVFLQFCTGPGTAVEKKKTLIKRFSTIVASTLVLALFCNSWYVTDLFNAYTANGVLSSTMYKAYWNEEENSPSDLVDLRDGNGTKIKDSIKLKTSESEAQEKAKWNSFFTDAFASGFEDVGITGGANDVLSSIYGSSFNEAFYGMGGESGLAEAVVNGGLSPEQMIGGYTGIIKGSWKGGLKQLGNATNQAVKGLFGSN